MARHARKVICGIYKITNKINNKAYVGQSIDIYTRWTTHINLLNTNKHHNEYLQNEWNIFGEENFYFNILEECNVNILDERERYYIILFDSINNNNGYNFATGGRSNFTFNDEILCKMSESQTGRVHSEETKKKISKGNKGKVLSEDTIAKIRESHKRENLSQETLDKMSAAKKGKSLSEEHRKKLSEAGRNRIVSEETRKKLSQSNMGHEVSEETREKLRKANTGKKLSEEAKEKVRKTRIKKAVIQLDKNENFVCEYESVALAGKVIGAPATMISACCKEKRKSVHGFVWMYKEDYLALQDKTTQTA